MAGYNSIVFFVLLSLCACAALGSSISQGDKVFAGTIIVDTTMLVRTYSFTIKNVYYFVNCNLHIFPTLCVTIHI